MLMVTHEMSFAREFADRVCFFDSGKIAEQGTPQEIFNEPKHERTRQFLSAVLESDEALTHIAQGDRLVPANRQHLSR